jgi:hypothetical protein
MIVGPISGQGRNVVGDLLTEQRAHCLRPRDELRLCETIDSREERLRNSENDDRMCHRR